MVSDLTALPLANASLLDEATAAAEAMAMCRAIATDGSEPCAFFVAENCHPQTIAVVRTRAEALGIEIVSGPSESADLKAKKFCGILLQYPTTDGRIVDYTALVARAHAAGAGGCRGGYSRPRADQAAWRIWRGHRHRLNATLRRADGLRRTACRIHGDEERVRPQNAGPTRRRLERRAWQSRDASGDSDARATHPPGKGHEQHLHRTGAACRDGKHVCGVSRAEGPEADRAARTRPRDSTCRGSVPAGLQARRRRVFRYAASARRRGPGESDRHSRRRAG